MSTLSERRQFITAALAVSLFPSANAQDNSQGHNIELNPVSAGSIHNKAVDTLYEWLDGTLPTSKDGVEKLLIMLQKTGVIDGQDAADLRQLFSAILAAKSFDDIQNATTQAFKKISSRASSPAAAVASIAYSSVERAKKVLVAHGYSGVAEIVWADATNALGVLSTVSWFIKTPPILTIVAIGGAAFGSYKAYAHLAKDLG